MKKLFKVSLFAAALFVAAQSKAQTKDDDNVGHKIGKTATKVGHKTSEIAAKGAAGVVDKKYEGKMAKGGQTIYINNHSHYYYVDKMGHRVFVKKSDLMDKPSD
jgi:hypothetical protein